MKWKRKEKTKCNIHERTILRALCELTFILSGATTLSSVTKSVLIPQVSGKSKWIVWPMYSIVCFIYWLYNTALLKDCINKQYKCVLLLLHPKPITFIFCIMFHKISCWRNAPFLFKTFILFLEEKKYDIKSPIKQCQHWLMIIYKSCWVGTKGLRSHCSIFPLHCPTLSCIACIDVLQQ